MATLDEIRAQSQGAYDDMSDSQLADAIYRKHYSDMDRDTFDQKIGLRIPAPGNVPVGTSRAEPPVSGMDAFGRGVTQAGSFGFRDELAGLAAAGGAAPDEQDVGTTLLSLGRGAYRKLTGDPEAERRYAAEVERQREQTRRFEEERPGASLAGQITGAVALPIGFAARAATLPGRAAQAAGIGAGTGALSGAGEAEGGLYERSRGALTGGVIGGVAGGVLAPVSEGAIAAGRYLARKPIELVRSAVNPAGQAERSIGRAYAEAARADPAMVDRLGRGELGPGSEARVMDVLGVPGRNLARSAANLSSEAQATLEGAIAPRTQGQSLRFTDQFRQWMRHPDAHAAAEAIDIAERTGNRAAYGAAMRAGDYPMWSPELERLTSAPPMQRALKQAVEAQQTRAITTGQGGFNPPFKVTPDGQVSFNRNAATGVPTYPNLEFWDQARRQLSQEARVAGRAGRKEDADQLGTLARTLNSELDRMVPSYSTARQGAAAFFGEENALKAGAKFVSSDFNMAQTRAVLAKMNAHERALFEDGFASKMIDELSRNERVMNRPALVQRLFESPAAKDRLELVFGKTRADELQAMLRVEAIMQKAGPAVSGGSTTTRQLIGAGLAGATGGYAADWDPSSSGLGAALLVFGKGKLDARVATRVADMLISHDPKVVNRGIKMIAGNDRFMSVLREINAAQARAAGEQAGRRAQ